MYETAEWQTFVSFSFFVYWLESFSNLYKNFGSVLEVLHA